jgi:hypothetical protein
LLAPEHEQVFAFIRGGTALVLLNFSKETVVFSTEESAHLRGKVTFAFGNYQVQDTTLGETVELKGYEGRIYLL